MTAPSKMALPWWVSGDTNAFFGLGFNTLVNVLVLSGLCVGVVGLPPAAVFGVVLPALGVQLLIGNVYYTYLARRLARKEGRTDVCAMPYGPSVPHMFIVVFVIMLPIALATGNPVIAWTAGIAWSFIIDKRFIAAAVYCFIGAALGFVGLIHGERVGWNVGGQIALGYLISGVILLLFALLARRLGGAGSGCT